MERPQIKSFRVKAFHKDRFEDDMRCNLLLSAFYGVEAGKLFGWTVEHRYAQTMQKRASLKAGQCRMYYAEAEDGMPLGMLITHKTENPKIKRLDALYVFEPFRKLGVAKRLLEEARGGCDLHSYSASGAVEWHLKNGFRNLGQHEDGTFEMFTGSYKPVYRLTFSMPVMTGADHAAICELRELEKRLGKS